MLYLLILIYIVVMIVLFPRRTKTGLTAYWALFFILTFIAGFRYNLGVDTYSYTNEYKTFPNLFHLTVSFVKSSNYKILWILFESTMRTISSSFYVLQLTLALFVNYTVFRTVGKYSISPFLTILFYYLLFYFNLNMEILRESVSICLLLWGFDLLLKKKYIKYYTIAVIAYLFHDSGTVLFIGPLLVELKLSKKAYFIIIIIIGVLAGIVSLYFIQYITKIDFLFNAEKFGYFNQIEISQGTQIFYFIKFVLLPGIILFFAFQKLNFYERNFIFLYIVFSIFYIQIYIFYRIRDYFLIFYLIAVANFIIKGFSKGFNHGIIKVGFTFVFLYVLLFRFYYSNIKVNKSNYQLYLNYYPYKYILDEELPRSRLDNFRRAQKRDD